jgi:ubiquinone/menaquinone biosynthesis C-methylase UbiE
MTETKIKFDDGAAYERMMGTWSRLTGEIFLDWLAPAEGAAWLDIGAGNGAFTELIAGRCRPSSIDGVDPSEDQLKFARSRPAAGIANFKQGDAMALPYPDRSFDVAVMALVIFFVPQPAKGVAEMARVLKLGGVAAAYAWDIPGGGLPTEAVLAGLRALGHNPGKTPSPDASRIESLHRLWVDAGFDEVETRRITVQRTFAELDEFIAITALSPSAFAIVKAMSPADRDRLKAHIGARFPADDKGRITQTAFANAVKGRLPK